MRTLIIQSGEKQIVTHIRNIWYALQQRFDITGVYLNFLARSHACDHLTKGGRMAENEVA